MIEEIKQYSAILTMVAVFIGGWLGHSMYSQSVTQAIAETRALAALSAAQEIAKITVQNTTVQNKVIERVRTETVYAECRHSPDTYGLIKDAFGATK